MGVCSDMTERSSAFHGRGHCLDFRGLERHKARFGAGKGKSSCFFVHKKSNGDFDISGGSLR